MFTGLRFGSRFVFWFFRFIIPHSRSALFCVRVYTYAFCEGTSICYILSTLFLTILYTLQFSYYISVSIHTQLRLVKTNQQRRTTAVEFNLSGNRRKSRPKTDPPVLLQMRYFPKSAQLSHASR